MHKETKTSIFLSDNNIVFKVRISKYCQAPSPSPPRLDDNSVLRKAAWSKDVIRVTKKSASSQASPSLNKCTEAIYTEGKGARGSSRWANQSWELR